MQLFLRILDFCVAVGIYPKQGQRSVGGAHVSRRSFERMTKVVHVHVNVEHILKRINWTRKSLMCGCVEEYEGLGHSPLGWWVVVESESSNAVSRQAFPRSCLFCIS